ncbi:MAG: sigma-54-dependent Fis family transcriptional regulator [Myxococcales bacterium]|nr:sigma-54-dependent Fis family transcriptional regulator [Myxococcales bacterium]
MPPLRHMSKEPTSIRFEFINGPRAGNVVDAAIPAVVSTDPNDDLTIPLEDYRGPLGVVESAKDAMIFRDQNRLYGAIHVRGSNQTLLGGKIPTAEIWNEDIIQFGSPGNPVQIKCLIDETISSSVITSRRIDDLDTFSASVYGAPQQLAVLFEHTRHQTQARSINQVLASGAELIFKLVPKATHIVFTQHAGAGRFPVTSSQARDKKSFDGEISRSIMNRVIRERKSILLMDAAAEFPQARSVIRAGLASTMCVPLWSGDEIHGVLQVDNRQTPGMFTGQDLDVLTVASHQISLAAENVRLVSKLEKSRVQLSEQNTYLRKQIPANSTMGMIGRSDALTALRNSIERVRDTRVPVLINGETGTGKELVARALHETSNRSEKMFVAQNCSAISDSLLESELFGHVKGSFTGASETKTGLFELADGGTIFLDELGEMPMKLQAKLLRVIQEGEIWPVGANAPKFVDVRIVSATHRNLQEMVDSGEFRQDLYFRLNVFPLELPALRDRRDDIPLLAEHFLRQYAKEFGSPADGFSKAAMDILLAYSWPGNIRELQNEIQRVLIRGTPTLVLPEHLSVGLVGSEPSNAPSLNEGKSLKEMVDHYERTLLEKALESHNHNKTKTAERLGITREGLHKKLVRHGVN